MLTITTDDPASIEQLARLYDAKGARTTQDATPAGAVPLTGGGEPVDAVAGAADAGAAHPQGEVDLKTGPPAHPFSRTSSGLTPWLGFPVPEKDHQEVLDSVTALADDIGEQDLARGHWWPLR